AVTPVERLDGKVEAKRDYLDQDQERDAEPAEAIRDRNDKAKVRLDHAALRAQVAALDRLRQHDLLGRGQQLVPADVGQEELQAVCRADEHLVLRLLGLGRRLGRLRRLLRRRLAHLETRRLELARQQLDLVLGEVVLERESFKLRRLDVAALLRAFQENACRLGFEQLV